ncbi:hypothetical protein HPB47_015018 [Ixodes persulcatus]|uniref:Uncharacterized protein n=1 Tax=Ixodes persulcatus TaxID=34615 RepID=A0AC60QUK3_IXOPE|nr:hypothetical protein HPB47_015018 [Ixodes persulcatus]
MAAAEAGWGVILGHCTCMAEIGEDCSDTAAPLFYLEVGLNVAKNNRQDGLFITGNAEASCGQFCYEAKTVASQDTLTLQPTKKNGMPFLMVLLQVARALEAGEALRSPRPGGVCRSLGLAGTASCVPPT